MTAERTARQESRQESTSDRVTLPFRSSLPPVGRWLRVVVRVAAYLAVLAGVAGSGLGSALVFGPVAASVAGLAGLLVTLLVGIGAVAASPVLARRSVDLLTPR